jgi:hypothetical protein
VAAALLCSGREAWRVAARDGQKIRNPSRGCAHAMDGYGRGLVTRGEKKAWARWF